MNKLSFLRKLKELKIKYVLLSDNNHRNLKKKNKDLDLYINKYEKLKFEKFIKKKGYMKRIEKPKNSYNRDFYINIKSNDNFLLDIKYELSFFLNFFKKIKYQDNHNLFRNQNLNKNIFFTSEKEFKYLRKLKYLEKKKNIKIINNLILKKIVSTNIDLSLFFKKINFIKKNNFVLFLGSDGVGKTTIIKKISKDVKFKVFEEYFGLNMSRWYSKTLYSLYSIEVFKIFKFNYFFLALDIVLKRLRIIRYSGNKLVLIDRFPGFLFFSTLGYTFYKLLLPKPDLVVLLEANENTRKLRKKDEFKNDTKKWKQVAKKINKPLLILQTDRENKDKIKSKIIDKIFSSKNFYSNFLK